MCIAAALSVRHLNENECDGLWTFGTNGKQFLNVLAEARVCQIARSYGCTPLAVWLLDCVFSGLLHPPGFRCHPTANAPRAACDSGEALPAWAKQLLETLQDFGPHLEQDAAAKTERKVDVMEAVCVVSLGGAAKTHLLDFFVKLVDGLGAPTMLQADGNNPVRRYVGNFSALAKMASRHHKVVYCPDEWGMAVDPARGPPPKGTSTTQMMSMQAGHVQHYAGCNSCMRGQPLWTGAHQFPNTGWRRHQRCWCGKDWCTDVIVVCVRAHEKVIIGHEKQFCRTFHHANGLATTLQRDRLQFYMFEDHSAATFRIRKALVPEEVLFATFPDVCKARAEVKISSHRKVAVAVDWFQIQRSDVKVENGQYEWTIVLQLLAS